MEKVKSKKNGRFSKKGVQQNICFAAHLVQ